MRKKYIVETTSSFRIQYVVESDGEPNKAHLQALIDESELIDWHQHFLGEKVVGVVAATEKEIAAVEADKLNFLAEQVVVEDEPPIKVQEIQTMFNEVVKDNNNE